MEVYIIIFIRGNYTGIIKRDQSYLLITLLSCQQLYYRQQSLATWQSSLVDSWLSGYICTVEIDVRRVNSISRTQHWSVTLLLLLHPRQLFPLLLQLRRGSRIFRIFHQRTEVVYYEPRMCTKAWGVLRMLAITFTFALSFLAGGKRASGLFLRPALRELEGPPFFAPSYPTVVLFFSRLASTCIFSVESTDW